MAAEMNPEEQAGADLASHRPLVPGDLLAGKYRILEQLAEGGMGIVYVASQEPMGRRVALKVMKQEMVSDKASVKRFFREAVAVSKLDHPNTIKIYDYGEGEGSRLYIVMEFLDGEPLSRILKREGALSLKRSVNLVGQIARALAEAHAKGVIHRDMKPENIFVSKVDGGEDFVKVLDFGIAKLQQQSDGATKITRTGYVCGTPEYMSPEQARGEDLDGRTDLYALGVMLWEMLEGTTPYDAGTPLGIVLKHQTAPIPEITASVPRAVKEFVYRAMAKEASERPSSPEIFLEELLAACPEDMEAWSVSSIGSSGGTSRRMALAPLGLASTSDAIAYSPTEPEQPVEVLPGASSPRRSRARWMAAAAVLGTFVLAGVVAAVAVLSGGEDEEPASSSSGGTLDMQLSVGGDGVQLSPASAATPPSLHLQGHPEGAEVVRDGAVVGVTPLELEGAPGAEVKLEVRKEGFEAMALTRTFPDSGRLELAYTLPAASAPKVEITVDSEPSGARLMQGGALLGMAPHTFRLDEGGASFDVTLTLDGFEDTTARVDPTLGASTVKIPLKARRVAARRGTPGSVASRGEDKAPPVADKAPPATAAQNVSKYKPID